MLDFIKKIVSSIKNKGRGPIIKRKRSSYALGRAIGVCLALEASNSGRSFSDIAASPNRITIQTGLEGDRVVVKIADNGTGMPPEVKQRIASIYDQRSR